MNRKRSKAGLFLIELLIVLTVFAVCAAVCVRIFTEAHLTAAHSRDTVSALNIARNAAEQFKAQGVFEDSLYYYCANWERRHDEGDAAFAMRITYVEDAPLLSCVITVSRMTGEEIVSLPAASRRGVNDG
jgi:Tfp pilus assembly protein PilE